MVDYEPIKGDIQSEQNQPTDPYITSSSSDDSLSFVDSFKALRKAWAGSTFVKILSLFIIAIILLFIVFAILMVIYAAGKSICNSDLETQKNRHATCEESVHRLEANKSDFKRRVSDVNNDIDILNTDIAKLNANIETGKKKKADKQEELKKKKEEKESLLNKEKNLQGEINTLNGQKTQKDTELTKQQEESKKLLQDLKNKKQTQQYYLFGGAGELAIDVASISFTGYYRWKLNAVEDDADSAELKNKELKGSLENMKSRIAHTGQDIKRIQGQIYETERHIEACNSSLKIEGQRLGTCINEEAQLHENAKVLIELGLDQAVAFLLNNRTNHTIEATLEYNSTLHGFHSDIFHDIVKGMHPMILVMQTLGGYTFGVFTNVSYDREDKSYKEDPGAFTFSTTRHHYCPIRTKDGKAIVFTEDLLNIGDGEIIIHSSDSTESDGVVNAGKTFNCGSIDAHKFYAEDGHFTVIEVVAYRLIISHHEDYYFD